MGTAAERRANYAAKGTPKGQRTRAQLLDAARVVFETKGYFEASVDDIVTEAGLARGSFYTYFEDKLEVFRLLSSQVNAEVLEAVSGNVGTPGTDPILKLHQSNTRYIETYRRNAALYGLIEQVATADPVVHAEREQRRRTNVERVTTSIEGWQRRGLADQGIDAATTAAVLVSMTSNICYWWLVGGEEHDQDQTILTITETWVRAIGLGRSSGGLPSASLQGSSEATAANG